MRNLDAGAKMPTSFDGYQYVAADDFLMCLLILMSPHVALDLLSRAE